MKAEKKIGLAIVGGRRSLVDADHAVIVPGQDDPDAESAFHEPAKPARDVQGQLLFLEATCSAHADLVTAVPRVDRQRLQGLAGLQAGKPRRLCRRKPWVGGRKLRIRRRRSSLRHGDFDDDARRIVRSGDCGPGGARLTVQCDKHHVRLIADPHAIDQSRGAERKDWFDRIGLTRKYQPGWLRSSPRPVWRARSRLAARVGGPGASTRAETRGTRISPTSSRRAARRRSIRWS